MVFCRFPRGFQGWIQVTCAVGEGADPAADVCVVALDEDGLVEWGQLQLLRRHLGRLPGMPRLLPEPWLGVGSLGR